MDATRYVVRPRSTTDALAESRLRNRVHPDDPISVEQIARNDRFLEAPRIFRHSLAAEERRSGELVATGSLYNSPWAFDPDRYQIGVLVDPAHQGGGIGRHLYLALEAVAAARHGTTLWSRVRTDEPRSVRFFERAGFVERRRTWDSRLDLAKPVPVAPARIRSDGTTEGVVFTTLSEEGASRPEVLHRLHRLESESATDDPRMAPTTPISFEQFLEITVRKPEFLPEGIFLARVGEEYVALTALSRVLSEPDTLHVDYTGTLRPHRGRGLGTELKRRSVEYARAAGYRFLRTENDSMNRPIWAINERLGFRPERTYIHGAKDLGVPGGGPSSA